MQYEEGVRLAILGAVHDHQWPVFGHKGYLAEIKAIPDYQVVAFADAASDVRQRLQVVFPEATGYDSYLDMLERESIDAVCLGLPNNEKAEAVEALAARGIHVIMDKPMAATLEQARRIHLAAERSGIILMENSPAAWRPALTEGLRMAGSGAVGDIHWLRARMASPGAKRHGATDTFMAWVHDMTANGGGALTDYACYGAKYAAVLLGAPDSVMASTGHFVRDDIPTEMEDDSVVILEYKKARAVVEGSWTQYGHNSDREIDPLNGGMIVHGSSGVLRAYPRKRYIEVVNEEFPEGKRIDDIQLADAAPLNGPDYFLRCLREGRQPEGMASAEHAYTVQRVMEAAYLSAREGRRVYLDEPGMS